MKAVLIRSILLLAVSLLLPVLAHGQQQATKPPVKLGNAITYHVEISYTLKHPKPGRPSSVYIINQIPRKRLWSGVTTVEGVRNFRAYPTPPQIQVLDGVARHSETNQPWPSTWEVDRLPQKFWVWRGFEIKDAKIRVGCEYDVTSVSRTLDVGAVKATREDLKALPEGMTGQTQRLQRQLPRECLPLAEKIAGSETNLARIVEKISAWVGKEITDAADQYPGGPYLYRYDLTTIMRNRRGWCGPRSTALRALCLALGIPAREVNGFTFRTDRRVKDEPINKRNGIGNNHVWAEVYLPGIGWVEINPAQGAPFAIPATFVRVWEEEDPWAWMWDENGARMAAEYDDRITVTERMGE